MKFHRIVILFVVLLMSTYNCIAQEQGAKNYYLDLYKRAYSNYPTNLDSVIFYLEKGNPQFLSSFKNLDLKFRMLESKAFLRANNPNKALVIIDGVISQSKNDTISGRAISLKSNILRALGNYEESIATKREALPFVSFVKDTLSLISIYNGLGILYEELDKLDSSIFYYLKCLDLDERIEDKGIGYTLGNLAIVFNKLGDIKKAKYYTKKAIAKSKEFNNTRALIGGISRYAGIMIDESKLDSAVYFYEKGIELSLQNNKSMQLASNYLNISYIHLKNNDPQNAIKTLKLGEEYAKGTKREVKYLLYLAEAYQVDGNPRKSMQYLSKIKTEFVDRLTPSDKRGVFEIEENNAIANRDYKKAHTALQNVESLKDSLYSVEKNRLVLDTEAKWQNEKKSLENENLKAENLLKSIQLANSKKALFGSLVILSLLAYFTYFFRTKNTKIKKQNEKIKTLNSEITHRVKNQFVLATELLKRQRTNAQNQELKAIAEESENHLRAVAAVNKRLEASGNFKNVKLAGVLDEIIDNLHFSYSEIEGKAIELDRTFEDVIVDQSKATYLGLILNELYTNSVKHAFAEISNPKVFTSLRALGDKLIFEYSDNGKLMKDVQKGSGSALLTSMIDQLEGELSTKDSGSMNYKILFDHG